MSDDYSNSVSDEFEVTHGHFEERHANLAWRMIDAWRDMGASTRRLIREDPAEGRLLFYVLMADIVVFLSWTLKTIVMPMPGVPVPAVTSLVLIGTLMMRTALMYGFAGVCGFVLKLCGGQGTWRNTRAGVFWGALVAAPFSLLAALLTVALTIWGVSGGGEPWYVVPLYWGSLIPFVYFIAHGLAEAHDMKAPPIFMVLSILATLAVFIGLAVSPDLSAY